jgi:putative transposase
MYESDHRMKVALFRFGVISPIVCRPLTPDENRVLRQQILTQLFRYPDGSERRIPERTLRHWLGKHRKFGFKGLFDEFRSDKGVCRAISSDVIEKAVELRKEEPARSVRTVIEILKKTGCDATSLSERTVARRLTAAGATKKLLKKGAGSYRRWEQLHVNDLWHGDTSHGIWLRDPEDPSKAKKTKFIVFVDDASRVCTHGEFYFDEQLPKLVDCFGKALVQRGRPCRLLFDNAFIYHSTTIEAMCAELGSEISFCRPRAPQGKGKVERFIKTVQDSFMIEANRAAVDSLEELNKLYQGWVSEYHNREHSELEGLTPLERWQQDVKRISLVLPEELRRALMLRAKRKVHINTGTVSVDGRDYQASVDLAGQEVEVRWSPRHLESVELWMLGEFIETANEFRIKSWVEPREKRLEDEAPPGTPFTSSKILMDSFRNGSTEPGLLSMRAGEILSCGEFVQMCFRALERELIQQELDGLGDFFRRLAPLKRDVVKLALERAIQSKGGDMHIRFYLEQIEQLIRRK